MTPLKQFGEPLYYPVSNADEMGFPTPPNPHGQSVRGWMRSLSVLQKEGIVVNAATGTAWRLASDEGLYLNGTDLAPNPLTFLSVGMVSSYMNEITALAKLRGIILDDLELVLDNFYYREGDFRKGTMNSGALSPQLEVRCNANCDEKTLNTMLFEAISASPLNGLASVPHTNLFALNHNGNSLTPEQLEPLTAVSFPDPGDNFAKLIRAPDGHIVQPIIEKLVSEPEAAKAHAAKPNPASIPQLEEGQSVIHMRSTCRLRPDGVKEIIKEQFITASSTWKFFSDEGDVFGGQGRAPDAATYISAGISFCFMTQMSRFAKMAKVPLQSARVIQDTHFSPGGASGGTGKAGVAEAIETHVFLNTDAPDSAAQDILGVAERTCFLHAFCRDDVKTKVRFSKPVTAA